jgi:type I restriction enzyme S subunit
MSLYPSVSLGNLLKVHYGKALKAEERDDAGIYDVYGSSGKIGRHHSALVKHPTIIVGRKGSVGAVTYAPDGGWTIDTAFYTEMLEPDALDLRFLFYALNLAKLAQHTITTSIPGLNRDDIYSTKIPFPPLPEQKRIAAILDKADSIRRKRQEAVRLTEELLRSVFLDMFGDPVENPKGWETRAFVEVCETRLGKMLDAKQQTGEHLRPYLRNSNVQWDRIEISVLEQMDFIDKDRKTFSLLNGDVLICEGGEVGRAAIWRNQLTECYFQKAIHRARPNQSMAIPEYVMFWLWFMSKNGGFKDHVTSATIAHLTGEKLKEIQMSLPPIDMQHKFLHIYNSLTTLKMSIIKHHTEIDTLFNSLLNSAFKRVL